VNGPRPPVRAIHSELDHQRFDLRRRLCWRIRRTGQSRLQREEHLRPRAFVGTRKPTAKKCRPDATQQRCRSHHFA
jgi:hypothetical protein